VLLENGKKMHFTVEKLSPATGTEITSFEIGDFGTQTCETIRAKGKVIGTIRTEEENNTAQTTRHKIGISVTEASNELVYADKAMSH